MQGLTDPARAGLLRVSAATCAASLLLLPVAAQSSLAVKPWGRDVVTIAVPTVAPSSPPARGIAGVRDPFRSVGDESGREALRPILLAYATGARPVALVDVEGRTQTLALGVSAFGSRVTYVDSTVVRLADGRSLALVKRP